jgi:enoyl-CoA hydratase
MMSAPYDTITIEREAQAGVTVLRLNRPERLNALDAQMIDELHMALAQIACDTDTQVLILTGEGRGFCSGIDIHTPAAVGSTGDTVTVFGEHEKVASLPIRLRNLPQPVIAAVNGPAAGGGFALALGADVRICAPEGSFNVAFIKLGLSGCDTGVSYMLPRIVGAGIAAELMLTGRFVGAEEAEELKLVNRVVPQERLLDEALALAGEICANSPFAVKMTKRVLQRNVDATSIEAAVDLENRTQVLTTRTEDMSEALAAFLEKRAPRFSGR